MYSFSMEKTRHFAQETSSLCENQEQPEVSKKIFVFFTYFMNQLVDFYFHKYYLK